MALIASEISRSTSQRALWRPPPMPSPTGRATKRAAAGWGLPPVLVVGRRLPWHQLRSGRSCPVVSVLLSEVVVVELDVGFAVGVDGDGYVVGVDLVVMSGAQKGKIGQAGGASA